jgi:hypothetical protein
MRVLARAAVWLTALSAASLVSGCSGAPTGAPAGQHGPAAPPGAAAGRDAAASASTDGHLQLGHLAPDAPSFDGYFARFGQDGKLVGTGGYGSLGPYMSLPPGRYVWSMRPAGSPPNAPLTLTKLIEVKPGQTSTVVLFNNGAQGALQGVVTPEDAAPPAPGMAKLRIVQGADGAPLSITVGNGPAQQVPYGTVAAYQSMPVGPLTVKADPGGAVMHGDLAPGSVTTVLVTKDAHGLHLTPSTDNTAPSPLAAAPPRGVDTGSGGQAAASVEPTVASRLVDPLAGTGALLVMIAAVGYLVRRRRA